MPRNITVTFDDGSNHVYNNAPDDVTPEQIESRASRDFAGKRVTALDGGRAAPSASAPARQPVADIPGTPEGYADRVGLIPTDQYQPAPQAQRPAPVPQEERGLFSRIRAGVEAARSTIASIVPGGVGFGLGAAEGMLRNIASGKFGTQEGAGLVEQTASKRAQQFTEATVAKPPSALGQEYAQDVGEFMQRHGASVLAGPLGVTGTGRHTENLRNARQGLKAAMATTEAPPGLPPVAGEAPGAVKPAGGLAKRMVQPNPALLEAVPAAEKAGLTVLPHHVAEGETVRALGTAAGGTVYKQNTKAFTKALIKELDPESPAEQLTIKNYHAAFDKQGRGIGAGMSRHNIPLEDMRARLEAISKDVAGNADAETGRLTTNRINDIIGKAEANAGVLKGQAARELDTAIGIQIRSNAKNQDLVGRLRDVQNTMRDAVEKQMTPAEAKEMREFRRRYAYAMEILPDIDDFGRTGYYEPGQLWKRLTGSEAGRQRVANERGGLTDLAKAGALVADRSGTGHGYVSVGGNSVGVGTGGMRAYASPGRLLELGVGAVGGSKAYNRFGPNLVKRLAAEHDAELARAAQKPEPPPQAPDTPPPVPDTPPPAPDTSLPAAPDTPQPPVSEQIPVGAATEMSIPEAQRAVSQSAVDPRLAKIADLRRQAPSAAVKKVLDAREAEIKKIIKRETDITELDAAAQATDDVDLRQSLLAEANKLRGGTLPVGEVAEGQPGLPKPKAEKIPVGKVIEGQPDLPTAPAERLPVGEATEITPEVVEAAPERLPVGEATEMPEMPEPLPVGEVTENPIPVGEAMEFEPLPAGEVTEITPELVVPEATNVDNATTAPAGGGRSEGMEQTKGEFTQSLLRDPASWVIREKATGKVVMETFDRKKVDALNTEKYEAVPALQHLQEINRSAKEPTRTPQVPAGGGRSEGVEPTKNAPAGGGAGMEPTRGMTRQQLLDAQDAEIAKSQRQWDEEKAAVEKELGALQSKLSGIRGKGEKQDALNERARDARLAHEARAREILDKFRPQIDAHPEEVARRAASLAAAKQRQQEATPQAPAGGGAGTEPTKITHAGMEIEEIPGKSGEPTWWQVTVPETGERVQTPSGLDAAKRMAENERKVIERHGTRPEREKAAEAARAAEEQARADAKKARSAETAGKSLAEIKAMDHMNRTIRADGKDMKAHEFVDARLAAGDAPKVEMVDRVAPMPRRAFNNASNAEQRAHEAKVKAAGKKESYWLGGYNLSKTEYDYAVKKDTARAPQAPAGYVAEKPAQDQAGSTAAGPGGSRAVPVSALNDGVADLGRVIQPGYYSEGYPWQTGYEAQVSGSSIAQDGRDILAAGEKYTVPGMRLRDAIRHAEIVGDPVPQEAYARLESLKRKPTPKAASKEPAPAPQAPAGGAQPKATPEPVKPAAVEPDPLALTPKQYHEAKLRSMADENGVSMPEVREMYDTEAGRANNTQEWVQAVMDAAKAGKPITRATLDKLEEVRPRAVGQLMHDYPYAKLPEGYQVPGARKAETEEAAARRANRAAAKADARAPQTTPEPVEPAAPKPAGKAMTPAEVKAELVRQLDEAHAKAGGDQFTPDDVSGPHRENGNQVLHMRHQPDAESPYNIYLRAVRDDKQGYWTVYGTYGTTGKEVRLDQTAGLSPAGAKGYLARLMPNVAEKDGVPKISPRNSFVTVRAGGSEYKIRNTRERIAEFKKALDTVKGGKTPKPVSEKTDLTGRGWLGGTSKRAPLKTITDMIDDFDAQAAVDFAAAQGIDLEVALKADRKRLDRVRGLKPTPDTP